MNIVIFHFPYFSTFGGLEQQNLDLFSGLQKRGYQITFGGRPEEILFESMKKIGIKTVSVWAPRMASNMASGIWTLICAPFAFLNFWQWLKKLQKAKDKNILFLISLNEKILATIPALILGYKVIWVEHVQIGRWLSHHPFRSLYSRLSQRVTIVVPSKVSVRLLKKIGAHNIQVIPNGIDQKLFKKEKDLTSNKFSKKSKSEIRIGMIGRLNGLIPSDKLLQTREPLRARYHDRGVDIFIYTLSFLQKKFPQIRGLIVGHGPEQNEFWKLAQDKKALVEFLGFLEKPECIQFIKSCDIFVIPSSNPESFSLTAAEALFSGIPTIISDFAGIVEIARDGAVVIPGRDPEALSQAISRLIADSDQAKKIAKKGQEIARKNFTLEKMRERYEKLFRTV